jgi:hypothetical protein
MQAFGHVVIAWMWLDVVAADSIALHAGSMRANTYFYRYELPKIDAWLAVVSAREMSCATMCEDDF